MQILPPHQYLLAIKELNKVSINHYFAKSVLMQNAAGIVYVDDMLQPKCFYIITNYGMSLIYGSQLTEVTSDFIVTHMQKNTLNTANAEWLQIFPLHWNETIKQKLGGKLIAADTNEQLTPSSRISKVVEHTRVNFQFDQSLYKSRVENSLNETFIALSSSQFDDIQGDVTPRHFWKNKALFDSKGKGICLMKNNEIASVAFSACIDEDIIEIGIETSQAHRHKGYALAVCVQLINYCIDNNITPVWACRQGNKASYLLAQKLGFIPIHYLPYYQLIK